LPKSASIQYNNIDEPRHPSKLGKITLANWVKLRPSLKNPTMRAILIVAGWHIAASGIDAV
jgi:hypothetical protein